MPADPRSPDATMDASSLYREEIVTDRKVGTIRLMVPVKSDGSLDPARPTIYTGDAQIMTNMGALPVSFDIEAKDLAEAVAKAFPGSYGDATLAKIGRNTFSSWEQTGHLNSIPGNGKVRARAVCTPSTTAFALFLGHLEGVAGAALFETLWARALDRPKAHLLNLAVVASQRSLIDFRHSGGISEVGFSGLLRPMEGHMS